MEIFIKQTIDSIREDLGYEEWEDVNDDDLLFQQGYKGYTIEVEDGDSFEIPEGTQGKITDEASYFMNVEIFDDMFEKEEIEGDLDAGLYRLEGNLIIPEEDNEF